MSHFQPHITAMAGYVPGEQPQADKYIKLNTNENPYPCSPKVKAAIGRVCQAGLQKYPDPMATAFRLRAAQLLDVEPDWGTMANRSWYTTTWVADNGQIREQLDWTPRYTFQQGVRAMVEWFRGQPEWCQFYQERQSG